MLEYTQKTRNIWFPDQVEPVYDPQDPIQLQIFREYWKKEKDRCINGFTLADGQVKVPGFLYWHTVYWKIAMYVEKLTGKKTRVIDTPYLRDIDWDITKDMEQCEIEGKFYTLVGSRDFGKALINSATLYTRTGELQIGDAQVGDEIYGADGKLTKITGVYPQGKVPLYQITLLDGRKFYCCDEHTWNVWDSCRKQYVNLQLKDIRKEYLISRKKSYKNRKGIEYRFAVPNNQPVEYGDDIMLPLDPYYLGAWLGDGTSRTAGFTTADSEILDFMTSYAEQCDLKVQKVSKYTYNITSGRIGGSPDKNSILNKLRDLNLLQNKHIPEAYFYTSIDNRMKLLQGLMDTDGSCAKNGTVEFSTTSAQIARGFYRLIRGLGILATVKKKSGSYTRENEIVNCKDVYRFTLLTDKPVFTLQRKLQYLKKHRSEKTSICNIEYFGEDFATCITVDNQDQLFLTDNYTVTHNSILAASRAGWQYTLFDNSEAVISAGAENYIKLATDKIEDGLTNIHPIFKKQRILNDWKKEVRAGWKDKKTNQPDPKSSNSRIIIRNYQDGNNTMAANGTRPGFHLIDEIGTLPNLIGCIKDSDGCWWSGDGDKPSCLPMFTGTGGDMEVGAEAAEIFFTPDGYNILSFDNPEGGRMGRFISALRARMAFKEKSTLADYLGIDHEDLKRVPILVSNEQKAYNDWWLPQYEKAKKAGNPKTLLKFKAYWPLKASDSFLVLSSNNYNIEAAKNQKAKLIAGDFKGTPVWLYNDGDGIKHTFTDKQPITEFPVKTQDTDAPVVIWEFPVENPPWGLYIAGVDPYRQDDSAYSDSLGAIYIFKRMHDISSEKYQDMFVASYVARPKTVDEWNEQARLLIKYYNAFALVENDDMTFIRYMQNKGDDFYLCDQPEWLKDVVPNTTVNRSKGIHRSSEKVRNFLRTCLKRYLDDVIYKEVDEKTNAIIKEVLGVSRVFDTMLLEEIIKFNSKDGNYDREVAASLAIALADKMSPVGKVGNLMSDPRYQSLFKNKQEISQNNGVISNPRNMFPKRKNKLFY